MTLLLLALRLFTDAECDAYRQRALEVGDQPAAHEAVLGKWRALGGAVSPGDVAEAFRFDCRVLIPTATP